MARTAAYWISRLGVDEGADDSDRAERELTKLGAKAVPVLVEALADREHGYKAAMILAEIGAPVALPAVPALTQAARTPKHHYSSMWSARALGALRQIDTLMAMSTTKGLLPAVVAGLVRGRAASYPALEQLLGRKDRSLAASIADELSPGNATFSARPHDFDALAAAGRSRYPAIRKDAALALATFRSRTVKARAVPILVDMLADTNADVRRLAVSSLGELGDVATSALPAIQRLHRDDKKANVRTFAAHASKAITRRRKR